MMLCKKKHTSRTHCYVCCKGWETSIYYSVWVTPWLVFFLTRLGIYSLSSLGCGCVWACVRVCVFLQIKNHRAQAARQVGLDRGEELTFPSLVHANKATLFTVSLLSRDASNLSISDGSASSFPPSNLDPKKRVLSNDHSRPSTCHSECREYTIIARWCLVVLPVSQNGWTLSSKSSKA